MMSPREAPGKKIWKNSEIVFRISTVLGEGVWKSKIFVLRNIETTLRVVKNEQKTRNKNNCRKNFAQRLEK